MILLEGKYICDGIEQNCDNYDSNDDGGNGDEVDEDKCFLEGKYIFR